MRVIRQGLIRHGLIWALAALVSACGGGGDGGGAPASGGGSTPTGPVVSTAAFPLAKAYQDINAAAFSGAFTIAGKVAAVNVSGSGSILVTAPAAATFEGIAGFRKLTVVQGSLTANGQTTALNSSTTEYFDSNYRDIGSADSTSYVVVTISGTLPPSGHVGDSGSLYSAAVYADSTKASRTGSLSVSYQVVADTADTVLLQLREEDRDPTGAVTLTSTSTYRIGTSGTFKYLTEAGVAGDTALTFTFN